MKTFALLDPCGDYWVKHDAISVCISGIMKARIYKTSALHAAIVQEHTKRIVTKCEDYHL
jgi:hypothetical protein